MSDFKFTFKYRTVDEALADIRDGKACNNQTHSKTIADMQPGTTKRCPICKQLLFVAPIKLGES